MLLGCFTQRGSSCSSVSSDPKVSRRVSVNSSLMGLWSLINFLEQGQKLGLYHLALLPLSLIFLGFVGVFLFLNTSLVCDCVVQAGLNLPEC